MRRPDPQKKAVYRWEGKWRDFNRSTRTMRQLTTIVRNACRLYGLQPLRVTSHLGKEYSFFQVDKISFNHEQKNEAIALHECAHYICDHYFGDAIAVHSEQWMGIYMWLLRNNRYAPTIALTSSAAEDEIRWAPLYSVDPAELKRKGAFLGNNG